MSENPLANDSRAQLHRRLYELLWGCFSPRHPTQDPLTAAQLAEHTAADLAAVEAVRADPLVLTEGLGRGLGRPKMSGTSFLSGTWCMFAAESGYHRLLGQAFEAGIHPDDPEVFQFGSVLSYPMTLRDPVLVRSALEHGASATPRVQPVGTSNTWRGEAAQYLLDELAGSLRRYDKSRTLPLVQSLMELMLAGARIHEPSDDAKHGYESYAHQNLPEALLAISTCLASEETRHQVPQLTEWLKLGLEAAYGASAGSVATEFFMRLQLTESAARAPEALRTEATTQTAEPTPRRARLSI